MLIWTPLVVLFGPCFWWYDCINKAANGNCLGIIILYILLLPIILAVGAMMALLTECIIIMMVVAIFLSLIGRVFCCILRCGKLGEDKCI